MAGLYANENFRRRIVETLRELGHDVLTSFEAGNANQGIPDDEVLDFARSNNRIVLTFSRKDFIKLHYQNPIHSGIIVCTDDRDNIALANRIHEIIFGI
jgi:predicted nuclease of predicted toxin-antitoxin system